MCDIRSAKESIKLDCCVIARSMLRYAREMVSRDGALRKGQSVAANDDRAERRTEYQVFRS
jgi:hypothetical protein